MRWMWIDRIVEHDPGARLVAIKNVSLAEEHLHYRGMYAWLYFKLGDAEEALQVTCAKNSVIELADDEHNRVLNCANGKAKKGNTVFMFRNLVADANPAMRKLHNTGQKFEINSGDGGGLRVPAV